MFSHGTNCAGIIAGEYNGNCGVGIAFNAQIASKEIKYHRTKFFFFVFSHPFNAWYTSLP